MNRTSDDDNNNYCSELWRRHDGSRKQCNGGRCCYKLRIIVISFSRPESAGSRTQYRLYMKSLLAYTHTPSTINPVHVDMDTLYPPARRLSFVQKVCIVGSKTGPRFQKSLIPNISENWTCQRTVLRTVHKP
jgi:hypothetical protein